MFSIDLIEAHDTHNCVRVCRSGAASDRYSYMNLLWVDAVLYELADEGKITEEQLVMNVTHHRI